MTIAKNGVILVALLTATSCMRNGGAGNDRQADIPQGGAITETGRSTAQATTPPEPEQQLNSVERADQLIGEQVLTEDNQRAGKIDDFVIDQDSGRILFAIVGIGGVLGIGETRVAVPPGLFIQAKKGSVQINIDKHKLARAPQVTDEVDKRPSADFLTQVYGYFGQKAWWQAPSQAVTTFNSAHTASQLKGMAIVNNARHEVGKVDSVVLNVPAGRELYLIISPSSDMNLGNNLYPLPPGTVKLSADQKTLVADITREKLASAPHFSKDDWAELSNMAWAHKVYQYYGQKPVFQSETLQPTGRSGQNN